MRKSPKRGALIERSEPAVQKTEERVDRAQSSDPIIGIIVGFAIFACIWQPNIASPICAMVAAVYGVSNAFNRFFNKQN